MHSPSAPILLHPLVLQVLQVHSPSAALEALAALGALGVLEAAPLDHTADQDEAVDAHTPAVEVEVVTTAAHPGSVRPDLELLLPLQRANRPMARIEMCLLEVKDVSAEVAEASVDAEDMDMDTEADGDIMPAGDLSQVVPEWAHSI